MGNRRFQMALMLALVLAASACHKTRGVDQRTAGGQVLKGSISDAMLPYDTVTSQPPLAPPTKAAASGTKGAGAAKDATTPEADTAATTTPSDPQSP